MVFGKRNIVDTNAVGRIDDFNYINQTDVYLDSACQSLRPKSVINAMNDYYKSFNSCGERVKYKWGQIVDQKIEKTRESVIDFLDLSPKTYTCSFTLNTTYGLNLILSQIPSGQYQRIITSDIEHNSVFLSTIELAKRLDIPRLVLERDNNGNLVYNQDDLSDSIIVLNTASNIDGRLLLNVHEVIKDAHKNGGIVIIDGAQTVAHHHDLLAKCDADAICFSGHKLYSSSLGIIIAKNSLLKLLDKTFIGGGMVANVTKDSYELIGEDYIHSWLEPGLQAFGEIIALGSAIEWLRQVRPFGQTPKKHIEELSQQLFNELSSIDGIKLFNQKPSPVISFYSPKIDSHRLAVFLSTAGIMARSGYFCCHYYLKEKLQLPPLIRLSIGLHTTKQDIEKVIETIKKFI